jgi:hypothetical protein
VAISSPSGFPGDIRGNLPPELITTSYVAARDGMIATMFIIHNR